MNEDLDEDRRPVDAEAREPGVDNDMANKIDQLKKLSDRKARGALSEEEFEAQKRRILE